MFKDLRVFFVFNTMYPAVFRVFGRVEKYILLFRVTFLEIEVKKKPFKDKSKIPYNIIVNTVIDHRVTGVLECLLC